jgi:hypothetical protein
MANTTDVFFPPVDHPLKTRSQSTKDCAMVAHLAAQEAQRLGVAFSENAFGDMLADAMFALSERLLTASKLTDTDAWLAAIDADFKRVQALDFGPEGLP